MTSQTIDLERIKNGLSRIQGRAADNQIIKDMFDLVFEVERLRAEVEDWKHGSQHEAEEVERLRAAVDAGREYYAAWWSDKQEIENAARDAFSKTIEALDGPKLRNV